MSFESIERVTLSRPEAWEDDVPLYFLETSQGIKIRVGTNYPGGSKDEHLIVARITFKRGVALEDLLFDQLAFSIREALISQVENTRATRANVMLGQFDRPEDLEWIKPNEDELLVFWFHPVDLEGEFVKSLLGLRFRYNPNHVRVIKSALQSECTRLHESRIGHCMGSTWKYIWRVEDWRAIPNVLRLMRQAGLKLKFVERDGFPNAPPVHEFDDEWWREWKGFKCE